jgi:hypothetical protein
MTVICPLKKRHVNPSRCLLCQHFGGFKNQGVLCFKINRWLHYEIIGRTY